MSWDPSINLGNVLTAAITVTSVLSAYLNRDKRMEVRHVETQNKITALSAELQNKIESASKDLDNKISNVDQKADRIEFKIEENTRFTNGVATKLVDVDKSLGKHQMADEIIQKEIVRRLDKIDTKLDGD